MSVLLSHPSHNINQGQGPIEIGTLRICNKRDPSSEVHRTKIVNGPSSTDMTSLCSPFLLHFLPLAFQAVAIWGNTNLLFSAFSIQEYKPLLWLLLQFIEIEIIDNNSTCTTVMDCVLVCKSTGFYSPKVPVPQMCTREAGDIFKSISLWKVWLESQAWTCFEPILGTLHLCILRTVLCGDTVGDNKPTCNAERLRMSGEQLYLLIQSSTSSCYCSTSAFSKHNRAFEELLNSHVAP